MPEFLFTVVGRDGRRSGGRVVAADKEEAVRRVTAEGQFILRLEAVHDSASPLSLTQVFRGRTVSGKQVHAIASELAVLLKAGFDLDGALRFVASTAGNDRVVQLASALREELRQGSSFADALARRPAVFSRFVIGMVRSGEMTGRLDEALASAAATLDRNLKLAAAIRSALIYPGVVTAVALTTVVFLLTKVIPQFAPLIEQGGGTVPADMRALISLGEGLTTAGPLVLAACAAGSVLARRLLRSPAVRLRLERTLLSLPIAGDILRASEAARFGQALGSLLAHGGGLMASLPTAGQVLATLTATQAVAAARTTLADGAGFAAALDGQKAFPAAFIQMAQLGEETGRLADMLLIGAEAHDRAVQQAAGRLMGLLPPAITIVTGAAIAFIMASLMSAMLSLNSVVF